MINPFTMTGYGVLARTMWAEDRGGGTEGMTAVGCVVRNRVMIARAYLKNHGVPHPEFGNGTFKGVCLVTKQFSCWNKNDKNYPIITGDMWSSQFLAIEAMSLSTNLIDNNPPDITFGATQYYAVSMDTPPSWADNMKILATIGGQVYLG